jgi:tRNA (cmo5U34)-methyltransferase
MTQQRDRIYQHAQEQIEPFRFDERVVKVFPDMIQRSVPGYLPILEQLPLLARQVVVPHSRVYDLGCSLGAATLSIRRAIQAEDCEIIAVDCSEAMVNRCREIMDQDNSRVPVEVVQGDILNYPISNASLVVMNFTMQFIEPELRAQLVAHIFAGLRPGAAFVFAEKIRFDDAEEQQLMTEWHHDFKRAQGYSDLEIAQKRASLERVMLPDTETIHRERLGHAGFVRFSQWFRCLNFSAFVAFKPE